MLTIRKATPQDAESLMDLYLNHLAKKPTREPIFDGIVYNHWREKIAKFEADPMYNIFVGEINGQIVSSATLVTIENLTNDTRPYAIIENVVTHPNHRGKGHATALIQKASQTAAAQNCYKIMLLTSSKKESTLAFYENCGFNKHEKTGFIKRF